MLDDNILTILHSRMFCDHIFIFQILFVNTVEAIHDKYNVLEWLSLLLAINAIHLEL